MCNRNGPNIELCAPAEAALDHQRFRLGSWVKRDDRNAITHRLALLSGDFRKGAGIILNYCPFTGDDLRTDDDKEAAGAPDDR